MCDCEHCGSCEHESNSINKILPSIVIFLVALLLCPAGYLKLGLFFVAYLIAGGKVLYNAVKNLVSGNVFDENFLMSVATLGAFAIGEYPEAVMVMLLYQIGEYLQDKAVANSKKSIADLMNIRPDYANIEKDGQLQQVLPHDVKIGDVIIVKAGEKIPLDGIVIEGQACLDTSALTGESAPRNIKEGENAVSGCINQNGLLKIKVNKSFGESTVSKILELVEHAADKKAKSENFITKFAKIYTPIVVFAAVLLVLIPTLLYPAEFQLWFSRALTFLVISCPCALVISIPLSFFAGIGGASKCGILIKGSRYMEALSKPYAIAFDKTGTLTKGSFSVISIKPYNGAIEDEIIELAAYAECYSNHPIAKSLLAYYGKEVNKGEVTDISEISGHGIKARVFGQDVMVGNDKLMSENNINFTPAEEFGTIVYVSKNHIFIGYIVISDEVKPDSQEAISVLKKYSQVVMLTGDSDKAATVIAKKLGIERFYSQLLPAQKVEQLEKLISERTSGKSVIFVGDGINDAPVLTRADVGIAMGALGSDAAIEAADVVIMDDKPSKIAIGVKIARKTLVIVKQNIAFALGIKFLFLILGAFGMMTMWGAVFADVGVTLIAVLNSMRSVNGKV